MDDVDKTKEQLINELVQLRQRIAELGASEVWSGKVEYMLLECEERYRGILDRMLEGCQIIGFDWRYLYLNEVAASHGRRPKEKLLGQTMMEVYPGIEKTEMFAQLRLCMEKRISHYMENEFVFPDSSKGCFELSMEPVPEGVLIRSRDITERKRIEEALKQSEAKYRELAESITDIFFAMDEDLRYTYWNRATEKLIGISAKDALGKHIFDIFPDDENMRKAESLYRKALTTKKPQYLVHRLPIGGRDFVFEINAYPTASGLCVYVKDVTERKKLEEALEESGQWYRHIFDNAPFGIGFASIDGKVINLNKAMETITGYSSEDFNAVNLADTYVNRADRAALLREVRQHGGVVDRPVQLRRKNGTPYDALLSVRLVTIGDKEFVQTICHDVTDRKRAEEALRESELRFRTFFENAPAYCYMVSPEGKIVEINNFALRALGYAEDELIGKSIITVVYAPGSRRKARRLFKKWQETGRLENEELKIITKEGVERTVLLSADTVWDTEGKALYSISMQRDITERKRAEEALRLSEQNFRDSIESSPLGIRIVSEAGKTLYANRTLLALYGYSSLEELASMPSKQRYTPESYAEHRKRVEKRKRGEYVPPNYEISIVRKDGQVRDLSVSRGEVLWNGERQFQVLYQDVTERKMAEEKYQTIIRTAIDGYMMVDIQEHILDVNDAYCKLIGYSRDELLTMSIADVEAMMTPEEITRDFRNIREMLRARFETRHRCKDGRIIDVEVSINYLPTEGGRQFVFIRDITERKKAGEQYQTIIRTAMDGFMLTDMQEHLLDVNEAYCNLIGYSRDELINMSIVDIEAMMAQDEITRHFREFERVGHDRFETRHKRKDGRIIDVEVSVNYLPADGGRLFVFLRDITERKRAEEALRASEARYRLLAENVRDVIWAMDMDLRFTYMSPSVKYLIDRAPEEVLSMSFEQIITPASQEAAMRVFTEEINRAKVMPPDPGRSRTLEVEVVRRDGSTFWAELRMSFIRDQDTRPVGILGVMRDISERKMAEAERRAMQQKAQLASHLASVGELSAGVAHEINNPLTGVIGYAELLLQEDVPEHIRNDLEVIHDGAKRVADVVRGLLTFARQTKPERTVVDINQVIKVALRLRAYELETGNIRVITKLDHNLPVTVADAGQLQQVFLNLIINAESEMRTAHGKGKLTVRSERLDDIIRVSFRDDGPGIAEENLARIFDPFFTTREIGKGTGLGLSICHGIVTEHGGRIWAESQLGKGATFIVELPVVIEERRQRQVKAARKPKKPAKGRILVVDDEPVVRRLLSQVLAEDGHEVETTDDGKDALNRIRGNRYNLILLDMKLPGISGSELYKRIKEIAESLAQRVVFITGDVMGSDTEAFLVRTKVPYITKPFDVKGLSAEIRRLLSKQRPKRTTKSKGSKPKVKS